MFYKYTQIGDKLLNNDFIKKIQYIVSAIQEAGYEPYDQLYAYLQTGNNAYITRKGDARNLVAELDRKLMWDYIESNLKPQK